MMTWAFAAALAFSPMAPAPVSPPIAPPPSPEQVLAVPAELSAKFQRQVTDQSRSPARRLNLLVDFLFDQDGLAMEYEHDATYTVEQAYRTRKANCLTFTLLAVALARAAGLEAYGQDIEDTLVWRQEQSTIYRTTHVNAGIQIKRQRYSVDVAWDAVIARDPPERIPDQRLLVHFYNNRAAELMALEQMEAASAYAAMSLQLDPAYATSWSNAGVLHMRNGERAEAERHYRRALDLDPKHPGALFNMVGFYRRIGDLAHADEYQRRLEKARLRDPFHQFLLAADYERHGDYVRAAEHYRRAISLHDSEHRFYFGLARAYLQLGQARRAGRALARAQALSNGATQALYQAKLDNLRQHWK
jgi:tetratricopeptide (TPR) repeat protein